jgi:uncharacterized protein with HEPN domain
VTGRSYSDRDADRLQTILKYCTDIQDLVRSYGSDEEDLKDNLAFQYSCAFAIMQIGEHIKHLSSELKDGHPEIDWKNAAGMRDIIAHRYLEVDLSRMRYTILNKMPALEKKCRHILSGL